MRVLIVIGHPSPNKDGTAHNLARVAKDALIKAGNEVRWTDLMDDGYDKCASAADFAHPIDENKRFNYIDVGDDVTPQVKKSHDDVAWATHLIIFGPMWYFRFPACVYAWQERVFTRGFSFNNDEVPPLKGKKLMCVITCAPAQGYYSTANEATVESYLLPLTTGFRLNGFDVCQSHCVYGCPSEEVEKNVGPKLARAIVNIEKRPLLPTAPHPINGKCEGAMHAAIDDLDLDRAIAL